MSIKRIDCFRSYLNEFSGLIMKEASDYKRKFPSISYEVEDLFQEGVIALKKTIISYNSDKGKFSTHLVWNLRGHFTLITKRDREVKFVEEIQQLSMERMTTMTFLSDKARLFMNTAMMLPEGLLIITQARKNMPYENCICQYLNINKKEIPKIKKEIEEEIFL